MRKNLMALLASNRGRGFVRAQAEETGRPVIYLYDVIYGSDEEARWWGDGMGPETFARTLAGIDAPEIELRVNSPGGNVFGGRAMASALREHPATIVAHVDGLAASAASFLIQAADRIEMAEGAMLMIHNAWTFAYGGAADFIKEAELLAKIDGQIADSYAAAAGRRGVEAPDFTAMMDAETWLTPAEAIAAGLADTEKAAGQTPAARVTWDLSAFAKAPKPDGDPVEPEPAEEPEPVEELQPDNEIERRRRMARAMLYTAA